MLELCCVQENSCPNLSCDLIHRSTIICNFLALDYIRAFLCSFRLSWLFLFFPKNCAFPNTVCIFERHLRTLFNHILLFVENFIKHLGFCQENNAFYFFIAYLMLFAVELNSTELQSLVFTNPLVWITGIFKQRIHNGMVFKMSRLSLSSLLCRRAQT